MGSSRTRLTTPDLFSKASETTPLSTTGNLPPSSLTTDDGGGDAASPSYSLPTNLPSALRHLDDDQLDRLLAALISELKQRGRKLPDSDEPRRQKRTKEVDAPPLAQGKLNAVRAAFKAGVRPSRIAREFGISHADVRRALASDPAK
jgi:DNA invertase Pin-like site-specific DNA recombinase